MCANKVREIFKNKDYVLFDQSLKDYTTFGIGGRVLAVCLPTNQEQFVEAIKLCKTNEIRFQVLGNGSNILASSENTKRVIICTKKLNKQIELYKDKLYVSAGVGLGQLIFWCAERGLCGLENLCGIPATIGGAIMMNAGAFGTQIFDRLIEIKVFDGKTTYDINAHSIAFSHHYTDLLKSSLIVLGAYFTFDRLAPSVIKSKIKEVTKTRLEKQPTERSAGCVFRAVEGIPAGKLIDEAGLKGYCIGKAVVSSKHANFIINLGNATSSDVKKLIKHIQNEVKLKFGVMIKREIEYLGERDDYYR